MKQHHEPWRFGQIVIDLEVELYSLRSVLADTRRPHRIIRFLRKELQIAKIVNVTDRALLNIKGAKNE